MTTVQEVITLYQKLNYCVLISLKFGQLLFVSQSVFTEHLHRLTAYATNTGNQQPMLLKVSSPRLTCFQVARCIEML